ncbi:MAG: hypothetical protein JST68_29405 [Bacteroidetes bacterium]|nr:hypothetical protein [Bacteroidota bacterium]
MKRKRQKTDTEAEKALRREDDRLWKSILEEVFEDFLRFFFPSADKIFDFSKGFEYLDKELTEIYPDPEEKLTGRVVDKLVKAYHWNGKEDWILVHVEVQSQKQPEFSKRMYQYHSLLSNRFDRPITSIAVFTFEDGKKTSPIYESSFAGTSVVFKYNALNIFDFTDDELKESSNVFALVALVAKKALLQGKVADRELLDEKLALARLLYEKGYFTKDKLQKIGAFLNNYVRFENRKMNRIFTKRFDTITNKKNSMGIMETLAVIAKEKGIEEGIEKGRETREIEIARNLITNGKFSDEDIASATDIPLKVIRRMRKEAK